jgi:signal transduction histidine kinase
MSRTRRLSLRARMMVMLIGVTTILLLIMGTVSTAVFIQRADRESSHFETDLTAYSANPVSTLKNNRQGYAAAEIRVGRRLTVLPLTRGSLHDLTQELTDALTAKLADRRFATIKRLAAGGRLDAAGKLLTTGRVAPLLPLGRKPFDIRPGLRAVGRWIPAGLALPFGWPASSAVMLFVAKPVPDVPGQVRGFIIAELITGAALIVLLALAGEWLIGQGLEPLDQMTTTANDITTRGDLTARMPDADEQTEVGRLGASINTMLDRIQQAFSSRLHSEHKVREFAADASHELRTPLTTIRGYAELYRQGALGPDQLPNAMRRIEQEAQRMSTLVAELLELARLDRTSSLDLTETDLATVVRDAVADAVAVEPQRPVRAEAPPRLVAVVDEPRIRQVLANLLGNVRAHTPVSTPVAVRLGAITGGVLIEVADAGPGMSREDAIRAFNRFHRATDRPSLADSEDADCQVRPVARHRGGEEGRPGSGGRSSRRRGGGEYVGSGQGDGALTLGPAPSDAGLHGKPESNGADSGAAGQNGAGTGSATRLNGASLNGASLSSTSLNGASLSSTSLNGADPHGARQNGDDPNGTSLNGADLHHGPSGPANEAARGLAGAPAEPTVGGAGTGRAGSGAAAERTGGSGLGLSIVQAIATAHGGRATLESWPGQGTKVRVWLPVRIVP